MENLLFLGVPILKHIRVFLIDPSSEPSQHRMLYASSELYHQDSSDEGSQHYVLMQN